MRHEPLLGLPQFGCHRGAALGTAGGRSPRSRRPRPRGDRWPGRLDPESALGHLDRARRTRRRGSAHRRSRHRRRRRRHSTGWHLARRPSSTGARGGRSGLRAGDAPHRAPRATWASRAPDRTGHPVGRRRRPGRLDHERIDAARSRRQGNGARSDGRPRRRTRRGRGARRTRMGGQWPERCRDRGCPAFGTGRCARAHRGPNRVACAVPHRRRDRRVGRVGAQCEHRHRDEDRSGAASGSRHDRARCRPRAERPRRWLGCRLDCQSRRRVDLENRQPDGCDDVHRRGAGPRVGRGRPGHGLGVGPGWARLEGRDAHRRPGRARSPPVVHLLARPLRSLASRPAGCRAAVPAGLRRAGVGADGGWRPARVRAPRLEGGIVQRRVPGVQRRRARERFPDARALRGHRARRPLATSRGRRDRSRVLRLLAGDAADSQYRAGRARGRCQRAQHVHRPDAPGPARPSRRACQVLPERAPELRADDARRRPAGGGSGGLPPAPRCRPHRRARRGNGIRLDPGARTRAGRRQRRASRSRSGRTGSTTRRATTRWPTG